MFVVSIILVSHHFQICKNRSFPHRKYVLDLLGGEYALAYTEINSLL